MSSLFYEKITGFSTKTIGMYSDEVFKISNYPKGFILKVAESFCRFVFSVDVSGKRSIQRLGISVELDRSKKASTKSHQKRPNS